MNSQPLISVIVPVYKVPQYLPDCIDSLLAQQYAAMEVILVDDGSPDGCGQICEMYARKDARIRVIHKKNGGLSDARNAGLEVANGDYISFVDSDDMVHPDFIQDLVSSIADADIAVCEYSTFEDGNTGFADGATENMGLRSFTADEVLGQLFTFRYPLFVVSWNKLYKKSLWEKLRFPVGKVHEDEFVVHELLDMAAKVNLIETSLYCYRQRSDSIMSDAKANQTMLNKLEAFGLRRSYFISRNMRKEAFDINGEILYRCLMRSVTENNPVWRSMGLKTILFENNLPKSAKFLLTIKKGSYSVYRLLLNIRALFKKEA